MNPLIKENHSHQLNFKQSNWRIQVLACSMLCRLPIASTPKTVNIGAVSSLTRSFLGGIDLCTFKINILYIQMQKYICIYTHFVRFHKTCIHIVLSHKSLFENGCACTTLISAPTVNTCFLHQSHG